MKINDLEEGAFKTYCIDTCAKESVKKHFEEKDFRIYLNDENVIPFNSLRREWGVFSNFHPCRLEYKGNVFNSSEQMYFYLITQQNPDLQKLIMQKRSGYQVKMMHIPYEQRDKGHNRNDAMRLCLRTKFEQCREFHDTLLSTGDKILIEYATWWDLYWGCYMKDNYYFGCNALGRLLMEVRQENID